MPDPRDGRAIAISVGEAGLGAQILRDLGISSIRQRTGRPTTYAGHSGFGIEISFTEALDRGHSP